MDQINQIANVAYGNDERFTDVVQNGYDHADTETVFSDYPLMRVFREYLHRNPSETPESAVETALAGRDSMSDDKFLSFLVTEIDESTKLFQ